MMLLNKHNISPLVIVGFCISALFLLTVASAKAADLSIDCPSESQPCSTAGLTELFSVAADGYWYPGRTVTKTISLKNSSGQKREMAIRGTDVSLGSDLKNVMQLSIDKNGNEVWTGSVADFYAQEKIIMGEFESTDPPVDYNFTVSMLPTVGDMYQNKEAVFDLTLGFWGEPVSGVEETLGAKVGGSNTAACINPWWWILVYLAQLALFTVSYKLIKRYYFRILIFYTLLSGIAVFVLYRFFCDPLFFILSVVIGALGFVALVYVKSRG